MAGSATVGLLRVILSANTAEFESAMKQASNAAKVWSKDLNQIGRQAQQVGAALTKTITVPIVAAFAGAAKAAMDFESDFANVAKTVDGVSDKFGTLTPAGKALALTFRNMAKEIPKTTSELTAIAALGGQMGVPIKNLEKFTKNVAALGVAVDGISAEDAAAGLAQIANVFGDKEVKNIDKMSSALVHLGNDSTATEADILEFSKRLAGAGNAAGLSVPEVMALGTAMANVGLNAEAGGTAMSTMIAKMSMAVSEGGDKLNVFAKVARMSAEEFAATWRRSPIDAIDAVVKGLSLAKTSGQDLNLVVKEIGATNIRTADTMKRLAGAGDGVSESLTIANEGWETQDKHLIEAGKKYGTTANQLKLLWNQIKDVGITFGDALLPAIESGTQVMGSMLPIVDLLAHGFAALPGGAQLVVIGLAGIAAAAGPALFLFGQLAMSAQALSGAFTKTGIGTRVLTTSFGSLSASGITLMGTLRGIGAALLSMPFATVAAAAGVLALAIAGIRQKYQDLADEAARASRGKIATGGEAGRAQVNADLAQKERELAEAVRDGNKALTARLTRETEAIKNDQTRLAMLDTLNRAIALGADKNISYANAVAFLQQKEQERLGGLQAQRDEQQRVGESTQALTDKMDGLAAKMKAADQDIAQLSATARQKLTEAIQSGAFSMEELSAASGLSEFAIKRFEERLKSTAKATKETEKATTAAEKAAEKHAKAIEKQRDALQKLGIVTEGTVNDALREFEQLLTDAGIKGAPQMDRALAALYPKLKELQEQADNSGITVRGLEQALEATGRAADRAGRSTSAFVNSLPPVRLELAGLTPPVVDLSKAMNVGEIQAQNTADSFAFFGIKTRAQLQATARAAIAHFKTVSASGDATAEAIAIAAKQMEEAMAAAAETAEMSWSDALSGISDVLQSLSRALGEGIRSGDWSAFKDNLAAALSTFAASAIARGIDMLVPGLGTMLQPLIQGVTDSISGLFRDEEHEQVNDQRDAFMAQFGPGGTGPSSGFGRIAAQLHALGPAGDRLFRDLINAKKVEDFERAMAEVNRVLGETRAELQRITQEGGLASKELLAFVAATPDAPDSIAFRRAQTTTAATSAGQAIQTGQIRTPAGATAATDLIAASFAQLRNEFGLTAREALEVLAPTIDTVRTKLREAGLEGSAAFNDLARLAGIAGGDISGPILDGINHWGQALEAAHNSGLLTQSTFAGIAAEIMAGRQALIDQGHSSEDVNRLMQHDLQTLWQLRKDYNYTVDESTGKVLDEAEAASLVGDQFRSAIDRAAIAMERAADTIERAFGRAGGAAEAFGSKVDHATRKRTVTIDYDADEPPSIPSPSGGTAPAASTGALVTSSGLQFLARGGFAGSRHFFTPRGTDTQPAMLTPGELVINEAQQGRIADALYGAMQATQMGAFSPAIVSAGSINMGSTTTLQPVILQVNARELGRALVPVLPGEARRRGVRVRT